MYELIENYVQLIYYKYHKYLQYFIIIKKELEEGGGRGKWESTFHNQL